MFIFTMPTIKLRKHSIYFCIKHKKDIDENEFILELENLTQHVIQLGKNE